MEIENLHKWLEEGEWNNEKKIVPHSSIDKRQYLHQCGLNPEWWEAAFDFLKQDLQKLEPGKYELVGDKVYAGINDYMTKEPEDAKWEAHRKYIDLQYVISGEENMGILPLEKTVNPGDYNADKDLIFFGDAEGEIYRATPESFFLFFPSDAHRPGIRVNQSMPVRKLVIKIAVAE